MRSGSVLVLRGLCAIAVWALVAIPSGTALAHTELEYTIPAADEVVAEPVRSITIAFDDPVTVVEPGFEVFTPDERTIQPPFSTDDNRVFVLQLEPPLAGGAVGVRYRVAAPDGHVLEDAFAFTVSAPPPTAAPPTDPPTTPPPAPPTVGPASTAAPTPTVPGTPEPPAANDPTVVAPADGDDAADDGVAAGWVIGIVAAVIGVGAAIAAWSRTRRAP